jgi:tetratricopeptide (TPR) repeat protein
MADPGGGETRNIITGGTQQGPVLMGRDFRGVHIGDIVQAAAAPVALAQLPALVAGFTGRDAELAQITGLLDPAGDAGAVVVSAVAGLAGVGKTALAVQAGHAARQAGWFPGGVLFINLHGYEAPVEPGQALDALLRALGVAAEHIPPGAEDRAGLYRSVLAQVSGPVLIIADNASSEAQVRPLLPGPGPHRVMVTSRHTLAGLGARLLDVAVLDDQASVTLLDRALRAARPGDDRVSADRAGAVRLAGVCGGLPLALQIVAALLKADPSRTVSEMADELADQVRRLEVLRYDDGGGTSEPSVAAAFDLSYRQLDDTMARMFRLLPVNPGPDVSTTAVAALADLSVGNVRQIISRLVRAHLVEAAAGAAGRWRMHDLLRLYAGQLSDADADDDQREQARDRLLVYYLDTAGAAGAYVSALPDTPVPATFSGRDDALAWLDAERPSLIAAVTMAASTGRDQVAMRLPLDLAGYLEWRRRFDEWLSTATISRDIARRLQDRGNEAVALNNLGLALAGMRRFAEAIIAHQDAAAIFRETGDRNGEGNAMLNLGDALRQAGRLEEAIAASGDAAAIFRETGDRNGEGGALNNLGAALRQAGRLEEAIAACKGAAAIFRETSDRHSEAMALNNLGAALADVGRLEEAIAAQRDAAAIYRETGDRNREGGALNNVGVALRHGRRFDEAVTAHRDAAAIFRETGDRYREGMALNSLGLALREAGEPDQAITTHRDAAAIFREIGDRNDEGMALNNLGVALREAGEPDQAITAHRDAAAIFREIGDRTDEGMALNNLGVALREAGEPDQAITTSRDAAAIFRETGDRNGEAIVLYNLGDALREAARLDEGITAHRDAAAIFREIGDRNGEGGALNNLGIALREAGRLEEAITAHRDAAAIYRATGDRNRESIALNNLESDRAAQQG